MKDLNTRLKENAAWKAANFIKALAKFAASGKGMLSDEAIKARLQICNACPKFTGSKCLVCGCGISGKHSLLNKLCYPTEQCPLSKWRTE